MTRARTLALTAAVLAPVVVGALLSLAAGPGRQQQRRARVRPGGGRGRGDRVPGRRAPGRAGERGVVRLLPHPALPHFTINDRDDVEAAVLLALIGLAVTEIALWGRRQQARASARAGYLEGVVSAAQLAASGATSPSDVVELVGRQIGDVLDLDACAFDPGAVPARPAPAAGRRRHHLAGPGRRRRPGGPADARRHRAAGDVRGRRPRAIPADVDQHGATSRPGTAPGRGHARRPGARGPEPDRALRAPRRR